MVKESIKKQRRLWNSGTLNNNNRSSCFGFSNIGKFIRRFKAIARNGSEKHKRSFSIRSLINCSKGSANSVEILLLMPIILFIIFGSVDYYITQMQYNHLENIKNYYTNVMKVQGTLTNEDLGELVTRLDESGFEVESDSINVLDYNNVSIGEKVVYRNTEKPNESKMSLIIKVKPKFEPFVFGRLLGIKDKNSEEEDRFFFLVKGDALSEKSCFEDYGD